MRLRVTNLLKTQFAQQRLYFYRMEIGGFRIE